MYDPWQGREEWEGRTGPVPWWHSAIAAVLVIVVYVFCYAVIASALGWWPW